MIKSIVKILNNAEEVLLAYVSLGLAILIVLDIVLRTTGIPAFYWLEELGTYVLILITLCGASLAIKYVRHPTMTALFKALPSRPGHLIKVVTSLFLTCFFAYLDYYSWAHIAHVYKLGIESTTLGIAFFIPYLPIGFFFFVVCIRYLLLAVKEHLPHFSFCPVREDHLTVMLQVLALCFVS